MNLHRNSVRRRSWTGADYDSYEVLVAAGVDRPAALVTQARAPHPVRRALRAVRRTLRFGGPGPEFRQRPAN